MNLFRTESQILWLLFVLATFSCHPPKKKQKKTWQGPTLEKKRNKELSCGYLNAAPQRFTCPDASI